MTATPSRPQIGRMRSLLAACLAAAAIFAPAADAGQAMRVLRADGTAEVIPAATDGSSLRLIVEFTTPPLARQSQHERSLAQNATTTARFRDDFARLPLPGERAIHREFTRAFSGAAVSIAPSQLRALSSLPYVRRVYRDARVRATGVEQGVVTIRADQVWSVRGTKGAGVTVAIIDTGIDYRHPSLGGGFGPGFRVVGGYDFVHNDPDPMDDSGHGTHVAGIVAANAPDLTGVAPEASLIAYKVLDANGAGWVSDVIAALERAVDPNGDGDVRDRADVANLSLSFNGSSDDALSRAVDNAVAAGMVVVVAAGNGSDFQSVGSPATAEGAITVGATDFQDALASFSSKGPAPGNYAIKPDLVAPGVNVVSAKLGGGTLAASGTSMASPHVAGAAALLRALHRDWTPAEIKSALVITATPVPLEAMAAGAGRVDALHAATETTVVLPSQLAFGIIDGSGPTWSGTRSITVTNRGTAARSYDVVASGAADGIRLTPTPATLQLAPGESARVDLRVDVDNAKVPYPGAGALNQTVRSMAYSGVVELRSSDDSLRVPWAFVKAARLRVRYDDDMEAVVFLGSRNSPRPVLPPIGMNLYELLLPPATYDFVVVAFASPNDPRETTMIVRESQQIAGLSDYTFTPADAPYHLTFQASDERGAPLRSAGSGIVCQPLRILSGPLFVPWPGIDLIYSTGTWREVGAYPPNVRTSAFTSRYSFIAGETCSDSALTKLYAFGYPRIDNVNADVARSAGGGQLSAQPVRLIFPPPADGARILSFDNRLGDLAARDAFAGTVTAFSWPSKEWNGTVVLAKNADPDLMLLPEFSAQTNGSFFHSQPLRVVDGGVASFSAGKPSPTTYVAMGGATLELGLGVAAPQLLFQNAPGGVDVQLGFSGQFDEVMTGRGSMQYRLFDASGALLSSASDHMPVDLSQPRRLEIEATHAYWIGSREGRAFITARLGGTAADRLPPRMTAIAVVDASSRPAESIARGSSAWVRFAAIDAADGTNAPQHVTPEATQAWIRLEGTTEWRPLQPVIRGEEFASPMPRVQPKGTIFDAALAEAATSEGVFDLRIRVEDASGNSTETVLEPAFEVTAGHARSRPVRH